MYWKAVLSANLLIFCSVLISQVSLKRFTSPQYLFSDEPNILDGTFHTSQDGQQRRFARSTDEMSARRARFRRQSSPRNDPKITKSKPLCHHNSLFIRWTDTNLITQNGAIVALCRDFGSRTSQNSAVVYISYDHGLSWKNLTGKFERLLKLGKKPSIEMYYNVPEKPDFILFTDKTNQMIFYTTNAGINITAAPVGFAPSDISINRRNPQFIVASQEYLDQGKTRTKLHISKNGGQSYKLLKSYVDVKAFYWGDEDQGDKSTDLFIEAKKGLGDDVQGYKLDCGSKDVTSTCETIETLTEKAPLDGDITDFLVKGSYMFVTKHNKDKSGVDLFVKYKRSGTFKKANIITASPLKEVFVYDITGGLVMLVVNHRKNETNLYNSLDATGLNYSLSLPRVLYHNPKTEVSSHWLRNAVKFRFVDIWRVNGLPSVYFATQLTVGPVGGRYLISKMTFDKGGLWKKVKGPDVDKYNRPCRYPSCSLHVNLLYGSIYRYSKTTPLMSRKSAPGLLMATGVLGSNLKITPDTYLSRDGGNTFKRVLRGKRHFSFGDHGGFVLASDFHSSQLLQYSVDFQTFNYISLPDTSRNVAIKKILTEPGEKGVIFLVIGVTNGFYHVYQVNATKTLGVPCTDGDFFKVNVTDVGVGGCAVHQVQLRNSSTQCLTGKNYKQVVDIRYDNCMCRRRHYQCDVRFAPDERGSCIQIPGTSLAPSNCPEGSFYQQTRGYVKIPEYNSCKEDNVTARTLSDVKTPCPVEKLQLGTVVSKPPMDARAARVVRVGLGDFLHVKVSLKNGHLPHVTFSYVVGEYNVSGVGEKYAKFIGQMNKTGSFVLHITVANKKSNLYYSVNVNVIRKLDASLMSVVTYPFEPSIKEKVTLRFETSTAVIPREYGFPLEYYKWKIDTFQPSQTTILEKETSLPTLYTSFNVSGIKRVYLTISNKVNSVTLQQDLAVTADLKPKNVKVSFNDPILMVMWDQVKEPGVLRYRVSYRVLDPKDAHGLFKEASCRPSSTETKCEIRGVPYFSKVYVEVDTVLEKNEYGPRSDTVSFQIPSGKPTVPQEAKLANSGEVQLEASWKAPLKPNGELIGYKYKFFKSSDTPPTDGKLINDPGTTKKMFTNLDPDVDYMFEVAAVNKKYTGVYSERTSARTGVGEPTLPPTGIVFTQLTSSYAVLTWTPPLLKKGSKIFYSPKSYVIYMKKDGKMTNIGIATSNSYNFTGLHGETKYEVGIAAKANKVGPMATYTFTTTLGPPPVPTGLNATSVTAREVLFSWTSAVPVDSFKLYQLSPSIGAKSLKFKTNEGRVTGLMPFTQYTFAVSATNTHSESLKSKAINFTTMEDKPGKPLMVDAKDLLPASSSVNVSWNPPKDPNGRIIQYTVTWFQAAAAGNKEQTTVHDKRWVRIDHLRQMTNYVFQVHAETKIGPGGASAKIFKTHYYPFGSQEITIQFEEDGMAAKLARKKEFKNAFIEKVVEIAHIKHERIADVNLSEKSNTVRFELISKEELQGQTFNEIYAEMDVVKNKLKPTFTVLGAKTKANSLTYRLPRSGQSQASSGGSGGSSSMALIVGLVCAAVIIVLIVVIAMMFMRYRRKSVYNKFDNQFQYNHEDDTVRYQGSPEVEIAPSSQKRRHKNIESVPLADADELT